MKTDVYVDGLEDETKLTPRGGVSNEVPQNVDCGIVPDTRKTTLCIYDYEIPRSNEVYYPESGYPTGKSRVETNKESWILAPLMSELNIFRFFEELRTRKT